MSDIRLLVISGSSRTGSFNTRLAKVAATAARAAGAAVTEFDLTSLALPVYHGDIEAAGMPAGALTFRETLTQHDALIVVSPEYNAFPTPLLINSFDWVSRPAAADGLPSGLAAMSGKVLGLLSASPGNLGGLRSLMFVRQFFHLALGMHIVPEQFALSQAAKAFDAQGQLLDAKHGDAVNRVVHATLRVATAMKAAPV
ncbi:NAD(P)H-dependent oxidoreductase [soil metagenome]